MTQHRVACYQFAPIIAEPGLNLAIALDAMEHAAGQGAKLLVLPELALSGYLFRDRLEALGCAETRDSERLELLAAQARKLDLIVVAGFCERLPGEQVANSCVLIQPDGRRTFYRKAHLWDGECLIFTAGDAPPPVVQTALGRIGMMICYDLEFPEWVRLPALAGAQLLCAPVNWPNTPHPAGQPPAEVTRVQANAAVNRMYLLACDRCGHERGVDWVGGSTITDANGYLLAGGERLDAPQLLLADLSLRQADDKRISLHNDVLADRRPSLYAAVCAP